MIQDCIEFHNVEELEALPGNSGWLLERFPRKLRNSLGYQQHARGRFFSERAAGCELRFVTDGPFLRITLSALETDATLIVYKGDLAHSRHILRAGVVTSLFLEEPPFFSQVAPTALQKKRFVHSVWRISVDQNALLVYHGIESFGFSIRPPLPDEIPSRKWLAYGSSITFGGNVFHAPNAYVLRAAHLLGVDVLNKGIPGSCLCESAMADYLGSVSCDFATLELGVNLTELASPEEFARRARSLVEKMHASLPNRPLFLLDIYPNRADWLLNREELAAKRTPAFREIVRSIAHDMKSASVRHIEAKEILTSSSGLCIDLVHPSDEGHLGMGQNIAQALSHQPNR